MTINGIEWTEQDEAKYQDWIKQEGNRVDGYDD